MDGSSRGLWHAVAQSTHQAVVCTHRVAHAVLLSRREKLLACVEIVGRQPVSYTHLTLPTICSV
eukprot:11379551-Alexandrium_andersonii.AAC.1